MSIFNEILAKYDIIPYRYYKLERLHKVMSDLGIVNPNRVQFNINFVSRKTKLKRLELPPKQPGGNYMLTGAQIVEIVKAFSPGGVGSWSWRDNIAIETHSVQSILEQSNSRGKGEEDAGHSEHQEELCSKTEEIQKVSNVQNNLENTNTSSGTVVQSIS